MSYTREELFSTDKHRKPKVGERVKIASRENFGQVLSVSGKKLVVDFDYHSPDCLKKPDNVVTIGFDDIVEVMSNVAVQTLEEEVMYYDCYLKGEVYGFIVETNDEMEEVDSCWGFYGSDFKKNGLLDTLSREYQDLVAELGIA